MNFSYTDDQMDLRESIIKFSEQELNHDIAEHDKNGIFPTDKWQKCADMQIMALPFPEEYGGHGANFLTTVLSYNALGYACKDAGLVHAIGTQILCGLQILLFGNDEQKKSLLPEVCSGEKIFAQAITEPGSGSDALSMRTKAEKTCDDAYVLNGSKIFITNGPIADVVVIFAVTDTAKKALGGISSFIVEKEFAGFERCKPLEKMGLRTLQNGELVFENCTIPPTHLLGRVGQGALIFNESMELERCFLPAAHLGTMERVVEKCVRYVNERSAFGNTIGKFQAVANKIAQMKVNIELSKLMLHKAATLKDQKKRAALEASIAKLFISESLKKACLEAVQIHGGYGFMTEYEIERDLRDSIAATIYSGTSEMQYNMISRLLGL